MHHWIILDTSEDHQMTNLFHNMNFHINTVLTLIKPGKSISPSIYNLYEVYNTGYEFNGELKIKILGSWTPNNKFSWNKYAKKNLIERRSDLSGVILQSMVVVSIKINYIYLIKPFALDVINFQVTAEKVESKDDLMNYLESYENLDRDLLTRYQYKLLVPLQYFLKLK